MPRMLTRCALIGLGIILSFSSFKARAQEKGPAQAAPSTDGLGSLMRLGLGPQTTITILLAPAVQRELKLTDSQKTKAFNLAIAASERRRELFVTMFLDGNADPRSLLAAQRGLRQENDRAVGQILDAKQQERLDQIVLQTEGPLAVGRPEIAAKLRINDVQGEAIQGIMLDLQQRQRVMYVAARRQATTFSQLDSSRFTELRSTIENLRKAAVQQLGKILDRKQKAQFNKMLGEPFDLTKLDAETVPADAKSADETAKAKEDSKPSDAKPPGKRGARKARSRKPSSAADSSKSQKKGSG